MPPDSKASTPNDNRWRARVLPFQQPSPRHAAWQIATTIVPYLGLWVAMYWLADISLWLLIPTALLAGGLLLRVFIIFHDCCHGSYFRSRRANDIVGFVTGVLTFTPYSYWRWQHSQHHGTAGRLDMRGLGDVWTLTVQEYLESSRWRRFAYRLARNPLVLFVIAPLFVFVIWQRFASRKAGVRERNSVAWTNLALLGVGIGLSAVFGIGTYLLIQLTILMLAGAAGIWLFYVQHQFEGAYWKRGDEWDYVAAALQGSSFYKLPRILQWFTGNIGYHHIHHLSPRIPNYHLERCHEADEVFRRVPAIGVIASLRCLAYRLWDESSQRLVSFARAEELLRERQQARS